MIDVRRMDMDMGMGATMGIHRREVVYVVWWCVWWVGLPLPYGEIP